MSAAIRLPMGDVLNAFAHLWLGRSSAFQNQPPDNEQRTDLFRPALCFQQFGFPFIRIRLPHLLLPLSLILRQVSYRGIVYLMLRPW